MTRVVCSAPGGGNGPTEGSHIKDASRDWCGLRDRHGKYLSPDKTSIMDRADCNNTGIGFPGSTHRYGCVRRVPPPLNIPPNRRGSELRPRGTQGSGGDMPQQLARRENERRFRGNTASHLV